MVKSLIKLNKLIKLKELNQLGHLPLSQPSQLSQPNQPVNDIYQYNTGYRAGKRADRGKVLGLHLRAGKRLSQ